METAATDMTMGCTETDEVWTGEWPQSLREFEAFVEVFLDRLVRFAFHRLGNLEEAEDVVQDVLVKAYADREKLRRVKQVSAYTYRMTANACADHRRRRKVLSLDDIGAEGIPDQRDEASQQIEAVEELERIEQYLRRLPRRQAEVIALRVLDQLSLADIAEIVGCGPSTVKARLRYGLQKLHRIVPHEMEGSI